VLLPWYSYLIGTAFAVLAPLYPLMGISRNLWVSVAVEVGVPEDVADSHQRDDLPFLVGGLERIIFVVAFFLNAYGLVGVWLGLKVVGGWKRWSDGFPHKLQDGKTVTVTGRNISNIFVIGSGLSLLGAGAGVAVAYGTADCSYAWPALATAFLYLVLVNAIRAHAFAVRRSAVPRVIS
jgi:hypothetical protein